MTLQQKYKKYLLASMWPDVAKFRHFCKIAKVVGLIFEGFSFIENFKPTEAI